MYRAVIINWRCRVRMVGTAGRDSELSDDSLSDVYYGDCIPYFPKTGGSAHAGFDAYFLKPLDTIHFARVLEVRV